MNIPRFPAYPSNGGDLLTALPKVGQWAYEPKIEDWHGVVNAQLRLVWNQYGKPSSIASKFAVALGLLQRLPFEWLDVGLMECRHDMMRGCIVVFDAIQPFGTYAQRRKLLEPHLEILPMATALLKSNKVCRDRVFLINNFTGLTQDEPLSLYQTLKLENASLGKKFYEGLVAKRIDKTYPPGRKAKEPTPWMMKHRFDQ